MQNPSSFLRSARPTGQRPTHSRSAFTLIELIVVILIIAILASLLLVGVQAAVGRARVAAVTVDIANLEQGIKEFQAKFSVTEAPPSGLILFEKATDWSGSANTAANIQLIRRLWPNFLKANGQPDLNGDGTVNGSDDQDINGDGTKTDILYLNGAECLAFFMGGIMEKNTGTAPATYIPHGFSTNPANPFYRPATATDPWGNRIGPFTELKPNRLVDDTDDPIAAADNMPAYLDAFPASQTPYQYFSGYSGRGYRLFGVDGLSSTTAEKKDDEVIWTTTSTPTLYSVYLQKDSETMAMNIPKGTPWNAKSFQIISAGRDAQWGVGGEIGDSGIQAGGASPYRSIDVRGFERDNVTNFRGGPLN